jgi:dTDP-4-amino-4,6-dideoxygalactose transaminase
MPRQIGFGVAEISPLQRRYVDDVLSKNRLSYGEYSRRFEEEIARLHDRRFAIFCNSGTSALQVAVHALKEVHGWRDGDEILVPAVTFVATSNVVIQNGLRPVFVDVEPDHFGIDPEQLDRHLSPRTRAILPVHLFGQPCDMAGVLEFANRNGLPVLEDSCETMFVRYRGKPSGSWGEVACFSTYVAHLIVTGVGGFAATNDERLAVLMRSLINHGRDPIYLSIDDDDPDRGILERIVTRRFLFDQVGYRYRATELEAALGLGQLSQYREILQRRQENATLLTRILEPLREFLQLPSNREATEHAYMVYPIVARQDIPREELLLHLEKAGIETRHLLPLLNQPVYRRLFGDLEPRYPVAARLNRCGFFIGCHQGLSAADMEYVADAFYSFFGSRRQVPNLASQQVSHIRA